MYIQVFQINQQGNEITVVCNAPSGETVESVLLWNQDTFKNYTTAIDLSSKLAQTSNIESFTITLDDIGESSLDGIYFIEISDSSDPDACDDCENTALGVATDFSRFNYCLIEYLCKIESQCVNCDNELHKALTMKMYIDGLKNSIQLGNLTTAITFWKNLNRACKKSCTECCNLSNIAKKGLGFSTLGNEIILY